MPSSDARCIGGAVFVHSSPVCTRPPPAPQQMPAGLSGTYVWGPSVPANLDKISTSSFVANSNVSFSRHVLEKMCVMQVPLQFSQGECKIVFWTMHVFVADSQYGTNRSTGGFSTRLWLDRYQFSLNGRFPEVLACVTWDPDRLEELSTAATVRA